MAKARLNAVPHELVLLGLIQGKGIKALRKASEERGLGRACFNISCYQIVMCLKCHKSLATVLQAQPWSFSVRKAKDVKKISSAQTASLTSLSDLEKRTGALQ